MRKYYKRKYRKSKLYRGIVKLYGYLALIVCMVAVSALDYHPIGVLLWLVGTAVGFALLNIMVLTLDILGLIAYEFLRPAYEPKKRPTKAASFRTEGGGTV